MLINYMNNEQNSIFEIHFYRDAISNEIIYHSDCLCHIGGVSGQGASFLEAETNFYKDLERHSYPQPTLDD